MIATVTTDAFTPAELPRKFEAGTPAIAEAIGLAAAIQWMTTVGMDQIHAHEQSLLAHTLDAMKCVNILGSKNPTKIAGCISFTVDGVHPHDLTQILSDTSIMLRAGHHCAQPLHKRLGVPASTRLSVGIYNTMDDIDALSTALPVSINKLR
jgi:cysteine desulfurase/selenocysteine lyase